MYNRRLTGAETEAQVGDVNAQLHPATLDVLTSTPAVLRAMLSSMPPALVGAPGPDGWSPKDVTAHLLSIADVASLERARLIIEHDNPALPNIDEGATLEASGVRPWPLDRLLDAFAEARGARMAALRQLSAADLGRRGRHQLAGDVSVADVLNHVAYHDLMHIQQVAQLLAMPIEEQRGGMRMF